MTQDLLPNVQRSTVQHSPVRNDREVVQDQVDEILNEFVAEAFDRGYVSATQDILLLYPQLVERFLHEQWIGEVRSLPDLIRHFGQFVREHVHSRFVKAGVALDSDRNR